MPHSSLKNFRLGCNVFSTLEKKNRVVFLRCLRTSSLDPKRLSHISNLGTKER
ncbi:unnamed protein product [Musa acuminata subsp. burmannicoides]